MLEIKATERGFDCGNFVDADGVKCSLQISSVGYNLWFGNDDPHPVFLNEQGKWEQPEVPDPWFLVNTRMHLSRKLVKSIVNRLEYFVETGKVKEFSFRDTKCVYCSLQKGLEHTYIDENNRFATSINYIWLGCNDPDPQAILTQGWQPWPCPPNTRFITRMKLDKPTIKLLLPELKCFVETGDLR